MKLPSLLLCLITLITPAFAEDGQKIVERKTCEQIKSEIATMSAIKNPTEDEQAELKQLILQQRSYCGVKANGRRAIGRNMPTQTPAPDIAPAVSSDALTEYIANKKSNCDKLNSEIEKLTADSTDSTKANALAEMQRYYDMDCVAKSAPAPAPETPAEPTKTDEEWAAEFDANLAAGLCGDGAKPNKYGCCAGETFKDMGNAVFACCPRTGGDCFPPIN